MSKYYLARSDYDKLDDGESKTIKMFRRYYDDSAIDEYSSSQVTKLEGYKAKISATTYELHYRNIDAERITHRKPHPTVKKEWDKEASQIKESIKEQGEILEKYVREDLKGIRTNLFVEPSYAEVVETKINELRKVLAGLDLRVDKLKEHYENVKEDEQGVIKEKAPAQDAN